LNGAVQTVGFGAGVMAQLSDVSEYVDELDHVTCG
jgi:hypothetical protein